jgi:2-C-methyl-D-erythritol 4-phosphate cytidylyltransferase
VVDWSLFIARELTDHVVLVVPADRASDDEPLVDTIVAGGATRSDSVRAGLAAVPADTTHVLVHDAARPVPVYDVWKRVLQALEQGAAAVVPVVAVTDTLRERDGGTVDRERFVAVQTPQGFRVEVLRLAHADGGEGTDDASLAEAAGAKVVVVDGDPTNIKITDASHLAMAELLVR